MRSRTKWIIKLGIVIVGIIFLGIFLLKKEKVQEYEIVYEDGWVNTCELPILFQYTGISEKTLTSYMEDFSGRLTYKDLEVLLEKLGVAEYVTLPDGKSRDWIPRKDFFKVHIQIDQLLDVKDQTTEEDILILRLESEENTVKCITQKGTYTTKIPETLYQEGDCLHVIQMDGTILGIINKDSEITLENTYLKEQTKESITVLYLNQSFQFPVEQLMDEVVGNVCDIQWSGGAITKISKKEDTIEGNLLSIDENQIEIEGYGSLERAEKIPIYKTYGTVEEKESSDIVLGNMQVRYVVGNGKVCAALMEKPAQLENIRVLILDQDGGTVHPDLYITADVPYVVTYNDSIWNKEKGELTNVAEYLTQEENGCLKFTIGEEYGKFYYSDSQEQGERGYEGNFEVRKQSAGYALVNELDIEKYLYYVVPSEMPSDYSLEALKVQAVCARSYACIQMARGDYAALGAHIDDSNNYQVYNQKDPSEAIRNAVDDTNREVITYKGEVIETYYFSTSCGYTDTIANWNLEAADYPYLAKTAVNQAKTENDLSTEEAFRQYITTSDDTAYDLESRYFRWQGTLDFSSASQALKSAITSRIGVDDHDFVCQTNGGEETAWNESNFGNLTGIQVQKRSKSGSIRSLLVTFENGMVTVLSEYNIRVIAACAKSALTAQDGSAIEVSSVFPSAFFCLENVGTLTYQVYGGGFGHGIGMSQCAAGRMAESGMSYREIVQFFYKDTEIEKMKG